jgi:putative ABC transport system permease protein
MKPSPKERIIRAFIRLFPSEMREAHGREMAQVLREQDRARQDGRVAAITFWAAALGDVLRVAARQHVEALVRDVRYALRGLRRTPGFAVVALVTIALGTGAASGMFAVVNSVLLRPLPYSNPERIALLWAVPPDGTRTWLSAPEIDDIAERSTSLDGVAGLTDLRFALTGGGPPEEVDVVGASANLFPLLGVRADVGRLFEEGDDLLTSARVVVLSHGLWVRRFGASPSVLGTSLLLDGRSYTIVGVLPNTFGIVPPSSVFPARVDAWVPLQSHLQTRARDIRYLHAVARLRTGVTIEAARDEMRAIGAALSKDFSAAYRGRTWSFDVVGMRDDVVHGVRPALLVLFGTVGLVLFIAAANVATLLLVRGEARRREMAIRIAVGATASRLIRQLLTEGLVLAFVGGVAGLALTLLVPALGRVPALATLPRFTDIAIDWRVAAFAAAVSLATAVLFTLAPAFQRWNRRETIASATPRRTVTLGRILVAAEIAVAAMVLVVALMLGRSFARILDVQPGFEPAGLITARVALPAKYANGADVTRFFQRATERLAEMPGVTRAAAISQLPLSGAVLGSAFTAGIDAGGEPIRIDVDLRGITPGYFDVMGIALLEGRGLTEADAEHTPYVAVVDETLARSLAPDGRVIGRRIRWIRQSDVEIEVVGIVRSVRHSGLDRDPRPTVYRPHAQYPRWTMYVLARVAGEPQSFAQTLTSAVRDVDSDQPLSDVATMDARVGRSVAQPGFGATAGFAFATLALLLSAVGVYGLVAFAVAQRRREVSIRMAIGASRSAISRMILIDGARLAGAGMVAGIAGAIALGRWTSSIVPGVVAMDAAITSAAAATVLVSALLACWVPAHRASRVDPSLALRTDT